MSGTMILAWLVFFVWTGFVFWVGVDWGVTKEMKAETARQRAAFERTRKYWVPQESLYRINFPTKTDREH